MKTFEKLKKNCHILEMISMHVMILYDDLELCGTRSVVFVSFKYASHGCHETVGHIHAQANLGCDDLS